MIKENRHQLQKNKSDSSELSQMTNDILKKDSV